MTPRTELTRAARAGAVLAVMASGLVLGACGVWTVAAWHDTEHAATTFTAGTFETQSQGPDGTWAHHAPGSPVTITGLPGLTPGGTYDAPEAGASQYTWMNVRASSNATPGGVIALTGVTAPGPVAQVLEYRAVVREASTDPCTDTDFDTRSTYLVGGPSTYVPLLDASPAATSVTIDGTAGVCLDVRVEEPRDDGTQVQGKTSVLAVHLTLTDRPSHRTGEDQS